MRYYNKSEINSIYKWRFEIKIPLLRNYMSKVMIFGKWSGGGS
jgi:hypothetical protein